MKLRFKGSAARPKRVSFQATRRFSDHGDKCEACHGTGKIDGHACDKCHGTGHISHH